MFLGYRYLGTDIQQNKRELILDENKKLCNDDVNTPITIIIFIVTCAKNKEQSKTLLKKVKV